MHKIAIYIKKSLISDRFFFLFVLAYIIVTLGAVHYHGLSASFSIFIYLKPASLQFLPVGMIFYALYIFYVMVKVRPRKLFSFTFINLKKWLSSYIFVRGILSYIAICIFLSTMTSFKFLIPEINPFSWDPSFDYLDRILHGGTTPWEIMQPLLGQAIISRFIDIVYAFWFPVMLASLVWFIFLSKDELLRKQFMLTYVMSWAINGTIFALYFSSVGPAFFSNIYPDINNPYQELMAYLNLANTNYPLLALEAQQLLWEWHSSAELGVGSGISSMPSMHVSIAFLILLACWQTNHTALKAFGGIFLLLILVGSVHLGWHYAIDGYFSIISTALIWRFSAYLISATDCQHAGFPRKSEGIVLAKNC